ncbi:MAG: hypothetical protein EPO39_15490 [Candidatus Manganitrophaceae bacterium]|nr:MAG: hypothetical protein EPO39_15490 [Candidatus Manganitrophaceae bacterium]
MDEQPKPKGWWQTLPGILTAATGVLTAAAGLVAALNQAGFFTKSDPPAKQAEARAAASPRETSPPVSSKSNPGSQAAEGASPSGTDPKTNSAPTSDRINLLARENGGQIVAANNDTWRNTADGDETSYCYCNVKEEAVYAFKNKRPASFDRFGIFIGKTEPGNVRVFELLIGNDHPTGSFKSIGKFQTQNIKLFEHPYQEFTFPEVKATYLKLKLLSSWGASERIYIQEVQLLGKGDGS